MDSKQRKIRAVNKLDTAGYANRRTYKTNRMRNHIVAKRKTYGKIASIFPNKAIRDQIYEILKERSQINESSK